MSQISLKSISGITSITTPAGVDNVFTVHSNDTTQRLRVDQTGNGNFSGIVTATTFSGSGASLTSIPAGQLTGTVPTARLGSGTASSSTFLAGDSTFKTVTGTTINNNANNRIITGSGTANTLEGESLLTYNTSTEKLSITRSSQSNVGYFVYHSDGNEAGHFSTIGSGNEGILVLKDGGTDTIQINGASGGDTYFNTGKFTIGGAHPSSTGGFTDGSLDVQGNNTTAFIDLGNPIPAHTNGTLPNLRLKSNCTSKTAEIQKIYGGDNNVYKHIEFNGRHTAIHDCYPGNSEIARFMQNGLTFNGDTASANALSDYEEGSWTPACNVGSVNVADGGTYRKIGKLVHLTVLLYQFSNTSSSTSVLISGVPFNSAGQNIGTVWLRRTTSSGKGWVCTIGDSANNIINIQRHSDGNDMGQALKYSDFAHSTPYMNLTITYQTS